MEGLFSWLEASRKLRTRYELGLFKRFFDENGVFSIQTLLLTIT
jgi:hypothetical protein